MSTIDKTLEYKDGDVLDVEGHNRNIYSWEENEGLLSTVNGDIDIDNVNSSFTVKNPHIQPGEVIRSSQGFGTETLDYMSNGVGSSSYEETYIPIAGASTRIYVPYDCSVALFQWSAFMSVWRYRDYRQGIDPDGDTLYENVNGASIKVRAFVDGEGIDHTTRALPMTEQIIRGATATPHSDAINPDGEMLFGCVPLDGCHMKLNVTKGWHTVQLSLWMEDDGAEYLYRKVSYQKGVLGSIIFAPKSTAITEKLAQRISFGFRNARILTLF